MNGLTWISFAAFLFIAPHAADAAAVANSAPAAFINVNVVSMRSNRVDERQTVIVAGDRIIGIGPTDSTRIPPAATRIDGRGRYLMPGLVDMHAHFLGRPSDPNTASEFARLPGYQQRNRDFAVLFVANGITSVRNMHGHATADELADTSDRQWIGPRVYSTGPVTDGNPPDHPVARIVVTQEDAERAVAEDVAAGRKAIKIYSVLSREAYDHIVEAAAKAGIDVVGHVPDQVGLAHAIESHQATIEHADDSFLPSLQPSEEKHSDSDRTARYRRADLQRLTGYGKAMRKAGTWTCPTIVVAHFDRKDYVNNDEFRYMEPAFTAALHKYWNPRPFDEQIKFALSVVRVLHAQGAGLLLGSDSYLVVPGFSALQELEYFVRAGLTPYEALRTGTVNAALALHEEREFGSVDIGKRADLILLDANPLTDIRNVRRRTGVMLRGRWLPEKQLQAQLQGIELRVKSSARQRMQLTTTPSGQNPVASEH